jgi:hypothetical protein
MPITLTDLIQRFESSYDDYKKATYNETQLRGDFLDPFFELLGWDIRNSKGLSTNQREVLVEEGLKAGAGENTKKPDYTFRLFTQRKFFVEAKKPSVDVSTNDSAAKQVRRYGYTAGLKVSAVSNFEYLIIYDCTHLVKEDDDHRRARVKVFHYKEYEANWDEITKLLGKDATYSGKFDSQWEHIEATRDTQPVDVVFLDQINNWRVALGQEIVSYEPGIDQQGLNDIVQAYINRIVFLRVCEDRAIEEYKSLLVLTTTQDFATLLQKFEQADAKYNSGLFDQDHSDELIVSVGGVFWDIIKQLYYPESPFSFVVLSSDVLGKIYEVFLTQQLDIVDGVVSLNNKPEHADRDIVSTPTQIIQDILQRTVVPYATGMTPKEILSLSIADIACGSGGFLLEVYQLLHDMLIDSYLNTDSSKLIQTGVHTYKLPFDIKRALLIECLYGVDKDFAAVEATKFGLLLKVLEDESLETLANHTPILPELDNTIHWGNSLFTRAELTQLNISDDVISIINPHDFTKKFHCIVGNPPYLQSEDMKKFTPREYPLYKTLYTSAHKQFDKYFLFIERTLELLEPKGRFGQIIPIKFSKVGAGSKLRAMLKQRGVLRELVMFGAQQLFKKKTTYTSFMIGQEDHQDSFNYFDIEDVQAWQNRSLSQEPDVATLDALGDGAWALIPSSKQPVVDAIWKQSIPLLELVGNAMSHIFNGIQTSANKIYIIKPISQDETHITFKKGDVTHRIELNATKPYYETDRTFTSYRQFEPNARVIYPYKKEGESMVPYTMEEFSTLYPDTLAYLLPYKQKLEDRDIQPAPPSEEQWFVYGRHQALESCDVPEKLIVGVLAQGHKYAVDHHQTLISSGGTAGYCSVTLPEGSPYSIYYLQAILNSKYVEWYLSFIGEIFRGGYIARGTKTLPNLPVRTIDFEQEAQKELHDDIVARQLAIISSSQAIETANASRDLRTKKQEQATFVRLVAQQNKALVMLYNLGENEALVPTVKQLYATD